MRIKAIESYAVGIPLRPERRMISALGRQDVSEFVLVRVVTDDGLEGVGEATVTPAWSGETVWGAQSIIDHLFSPALIGMDPCETTEIDRRLDALAVGNWFAKSALEMACWDIAGRAAGVPVYALLGGACRALTVKNRFSLGAFEPSIAAARAVERVAEGFDTIKVKVGTDPTEDIARVKAVRAAIGEDIIITVDANGGWDERTAVRCLGALAGCRIAIVEQPVPRGDYSALRRVRAEIGLPVQADEACFDEVEARMLLESECCDSLSLYPGKQGGIGKAMRIARLAEAHGVACTIGSNLEWDVATSAMMHFIVATPNMQVDRLAGDCLGPSYHEASVARRPLCVRGPYTTLHDEPGLGIDIDWSLVEQHRLDSR